MNGVPMKLDYSKTINEQLNTFDYYRNRYASYELELMRDRQQITQLTNNWNELEKYLVERINFWKEQEQKWIDEGWMKFGGEANNKIIYQGVLDKMKEIEEKNNGQS